MTEALTLRQDARPGGQKRSPAFSTEHRITLPFANGCRGAHHYVSSARVQHRPRRKRRRISTGARQRSTRHASPAPPPPCVAVAPRSSPAHGGSAPRQCASDAAAHARARCTWRHFHGAVLRAPPEEVLMIPQEERAVSSVMIHR